MGTEISRSVDNQAWYNRRESSSQREEIVAIYFNRNPKRSLHTSERDPTIPRRSLWIIRSNRLHMLPHKIHIFQQLEDRYYPALNWFVDSWRQKYQSDCCFLNRIILSDKCVFEVDWKVTKHNVVVWGTETHMNIEKSHQIVKKYAFDAQCQWTKLEGRTTLTSQRVT